MCYVALQLKYVEIVVHVADATSYVQTMIIASVIAVNADCKARCRRRPRCTSCAGQMRPKDYRPQTEK